MFQRPKFDLQGDSGSDYAEINCLPDLVLFNAIHNPDDVFCLQAEESVTGDGFKYVSITFLDLAEAVERCCSYVLSQCPMLHPARRDGSKLTKSKPIALFMESEVTLFVYITALLTLNIPVRFAAQMIRVSIAE